MVGSVIGVVDGLSVVNISGGAGSAHDRRISRRSRTSSRCRQAVVRVADGRQRGWRNEARPLLLRQQAKPPRLHQGHRSRTTVPHGLCLHPRESLLRLDRRRGHRRLRSRHGGSACSCRWRRRK